MILAFAVKDNRSIFLGAVVLVGLATDFLLTFVTPALALTTAGVRHAFRAGISMLRNAWPACALYVFVPPLAIDTVFQLLRVSGASRLVVPAITSLLALVCKGATVRFYVRRQGADDPIWRPVDRSLQL